MIAFRKLFFKGIDFILDASQSGGHVPIDFEKMNLSALILPGQKGLLGPQGIGLALLSEDFAKKLPPYLYGGTGSVSESLKMPNFMPDKFEPGTPNIPGIYGLEKDSGTYQPASSEIFRRSL